MKAYEDIFLALDLLFTLNFLFVFCRNLKMILLRASSYGQPRQHHQSEFLPEIESLFFSAIPNLPSLSVSHVWLVVPLSLLSG